MGCKNCESFDLDELEDKMFAHLINKTEDGFTVRKDNGTIVTLASFQEAKEFIFDGGLRVR